eukprot:948398-Amphidinium_carterae.3
MLKPFAALSPWFVKLSLRPVCLVLLSRVYDEQMQVTGDAVPCHRYLSGSEHVGFAQAEIIPVM